MVQTNINMRPAVAVLVLLSSPSCIAADLCATLGCSVHKQDGAACQCNYHCNVHHDCCADVAAVCQNRTDPCLTHSGGCKHGGGGNVTTGHKAEHTKSSEHVKSPEHTKAKSSTASAEATHSSKAHAPSAEGASTADATHSSGHASKSDGKKGGPHDHVAGSGKASGTSGKAAGAAGAKEKEHSKESEKDKDKNKEKEKEKASGTQHESHTHHTPHTHSSSTTPWVVVVLACITGLTLPITISIILVLRARCAHRAHRAQPRAAVRSRAQPCAAVRAMRAFARYLRAWPRRRLQGRACAHHARARSRLRCTVACAACARRSSASIRSRSRPKLRVPTCQPHRAARPRRTSLAASHRPWVVQGCFPSRSRLRWEDRPRPYSPLRLLRPWARCELQPPAAPQPEPSASRLVRLVVLFARFTR